MSESPASSDYSADPAPEYSGQERALLLHLAHDAIVAALRSTALPLDPPPPHLSTPHLAEPRGVFTSLYRDHALRGCVGYVLPTVPLYRAVAETAQSAALNDSRVSPMTKEEIPGLQIELSVLTVPRTIPAQDVVVGRHGLLITQDGKRGLLLPQVPLERNWDRTTFLEQTCRKAGLAPDAWQRGAEIQAFTAEVFGEKS